MAKLYFRYGCGKSSDVCITAYNFNEQGFDVAVINANNNEPIKSKLEETLTRDIDISINKKTNIYTKVLALPYPIACLIVDNVHYMEPEQIDQLFFVAKLLNITVMCYGDRISKNFNSKGIIRVMELANIIEPVDGVVNNGSAKLQFFYGAMNCSKTAKLIIKKNQLETNGKKVCVIKPKVDREETNVTSRIGIKTPATIVLDTKDTIIDERLIKGMFDYILVDEAQFLTASQIDELSEITKKFNIPVRCYGLKTDFMTHTFEGSKRLLQISDEIKKMKTVCMCGEGAEHNARTNQNGEFISDGEQIVIDSGNYLSLCDTCYIEKVMKINVNNVKKMIKSMKNS